MEEILIVHGGLNKLRAKAAALLVSGNTERFSRIIFSGGKTAGTEKPSEAENMRQIFLTRIQLLLPEIDIEVMKSKIFLEERSCDTEANASEVKSVPGINHLESNLTLLSSSSHLPRIHSIYSRIGFKNINTISAEVILSQSGKRRYKDYFRKYRISKNVVKAAILEIPLYILTQFEGGRKWIRSKTQSRIQNPPSE